MSGNKDIVDSCDISIEQFRKLNEKDYTLVDVRDEISYQHGYIPEAIHIENKQILEGGCEFENDKKIILYCMKGIISKETAEYLNGKGYEAYNLAGGYGQWLMEIMQEEEKGGSRIEEIERSLQKKFHKVLFSRFTKAINQYELIREGDKVAVCISGGKDSMLMAKLFQELKLHHKFEFELEFLVMDPGYSAMNREIIENNAKLLGIPITVFETRIFDAVFDVEKSPCYLCARMRRGHLYNKAKELGCNKIALGHHYDDVIETIMMGMLYGAQVQTMMPKLHSTNFEGMELIRPMYLIREEDIKHWRDYNSLHFIQCACRFTDTCSVDGANGNTGSKRKEIKNLIRQIKEVNPNVEGNIFKSVENVNLDTIIAYKNNGVKHCFLESYHIQTTH
ncbi:ATP-binding protein [Parasporobacterium paucivorans]|uniref:tRNA(Ile)-lysidine synthase TilS/MesJ n=1 Tax=Parasporobacterium paucivorans DSM 15970 TaxID=1122934 RepID=A0A1M6E180_9FIRM|nr:ATP-binding protein [Parasporobacterium paucivorans]SHI79145.1 tRNA(Ile)-lysidine synthase TilS/MesJ [Parasporobacterium paucivorans DSM 15970]